MNKNICVTVVTFNRLQLLKECIEGIKKQTYPIDKIIIVNNGSTDGTAQWLDSIANEQIQIIHQENTGSAGGFHTGIKAGYDQGFEWIWMMDDDVEALPDCLENLLKFQNVSECLHPSKKYISGEEFIWEHYYNPFKGRGFAVNNYSFAYGKPICFVNVGCFEGMLISRNIIQKIGFPNKDYFIFGDDVEYGFLASMYTNVSFIKDARLIRKKTLEQEKPSLLMYYYLIRNRHLLKKIKYKLPNPPSDWKFNLYTIKVFLTYVYVIFRKDKSNFSTKLKYLKTLIRGLIDCNRHLVGKTL